MLAGARAERFARGAPAVLELLGSSLAVTRLHELLRRAASADSAVLLTAEPGCGVEPVARELHRASRRAGGPFVAVECGAHEGPRLERLLLGEPLAGPPTDLEPVARDCALAAARHGTLFLHDVAELPAALQTRLARIIRDGEVRIAEETAPTACRLVASAPPGIDADVHAHRFRADLFRRLTAVRIDLPPLRDRAEDVPALAAELLAEICTERRMPAKTFTQAAFALLTAVAWPGNLAELRETIANIASETRDDVIHVEHVLPALHLHRTAVPFTPAGNLREARLRFERDYIAAVLQHHGWRMADAARTLGIQRPNLYRKARQLGIPLARVAD